MATSKIDKIRIQNFKFFPECKDSINIEGNHLLLYGENGSGKSSLYWALYTLLECANKEDENEIKKYFDPESNERLLNIHTDHQTIESFVSILLQDGTEFKISRTDTTINQNKDAKESNFASDFITYRQLFDISAFAHSEDIDLFWFFHHLIFPYIKIDPPISYTSPRLMEDGRIRITERGENRTVSISINTLFGAWKILEKGLDRIKREKRKTYPKKSERQYKEYKNVLDAFINRMNRLTTSINTRGNVILKENLGYDFQFKLEFLPDINIPYPATVSIRLIIPIYEGKENVIIHLHSFLNEAKLSALALAIRLAVLDETLSGTKLQLLVLDDLLISLDMSNRDKVLDILLNKYIKDYQIFFLTHDKSLFNLLKMKIEQMKIPKWCYYEMYADEEHHCPLLVQSESNYAKGLYHLKNFDYPASANYFRKASEEIFAKKFPKEVTIADNGQKREILRSIVDSAIKLYERLGLNTKKLLKLSCYISILMNPLSHWSINMNTYRSDLDNVKHLLPEIIKDADEYNIRELIPAKNELFILYKNDEVESNEYKIITDDAIYLLNIDGVIKLSNSKYKSLMSRTITEGVQGEYVKNENYKTNHLIELHKKIYKKWEKDYDDSFMENIFHKDNSGKMLSLKDKSGI